MKIIALSALAESLSTLIYTTAAFDLKKKLFLKQGLIPKKGFFITCIICPQGCCLADQKQRKHIKTLFGLHHWYLTVWRNQPFRV